VKDIPTNILEESISMIERTALKLLPILKELGNRLAGLKDNQGFKAFHAKTSEYENSSESNAANKKSSKASENNPGPDMKSLLGFLN
jgi:hypothetical protein